jgi:hypothetical protein
MKIGGVAGLGLCLMAYFDAESLSSAATMLAA